MPKQSTPGRPDAHSQSYGFMRTSDGISLRYGHWASSVDACRGSILVLTGRTEYMEKYLEIILELTERGFDVYSFDWRGQGLSDRMLPDRNKGYVQNYDQYLSDMEHILTEVVSVRTTSPLILLAHSMGGHLAVRYLSRNPGIFDRAILIAPMLGIGTAALPMSVARWLCRLMVRLGWERLNIPRSLKHSQANQVFEGNPLTSDALRFDRVQKFNAAHPELVVGTITFGWLAATFESIDALRRPGIGSRITLPTLVFMAGQDRVVSNGAILQFASQLPQGRLVTISGAYHEIIQERDELRDQFWQALDRFVAN